MTTFFSAPVIPTAPSALRRTLAIWLLSNLGGTGLLTLDFGIGNVADLTIPMLVGFMAALISLAYVPLAWPFFALAQRACTSGRCRLLAIGGVVVIFGMANYLLLCWLPIGNFSHLLTFSYPYLGAALLAVAWYYWPQGTKVSKRTRPTSPAPLLNAWCGRPTHRRALLAQ